MQMQKGVSHCKVRRFTSNRGSLITTHQETVIVVEPGISMITQSVELVKKVLQND